CQQHNSMPLTF
nr:immunoglobulin light chain junction region [Macaca mulatta]